MLIKKLLPVFVFLFMLPMAIMAQVTTSSLSGSVKDDKGNPLSGATVSLVHGPTGTTYTMSTKANGYYAFQNIAPGGPYTLTTSFVGFKTYQDANINLGLGENTVSNVILINNASELAEVVVAGTARAASNAKGGSETNIGRDKMANMPSVGRNLSDYLRYVPQAKITGDGGVSLAGQNNRYNSFYIDGAVNNDVFGLSASGTNGGQANIAPISMDAIDQMQVILSPYDVSLGNFTGGGINATTRSGTNEIKGSLYYLFRNQNLSGKTPGINLTKDERTKLPDFSNKTYGFRVGGPIIKNKLFYFLSAEMQRDEKPQPYSTPADYRGSAGIDSIPILAEYVKTKYGYDPGQYLTNPELVEANRVAAKIDWNASSKQKVTISYRYNEGFRNNVSRSSNSTINFYNNGYKMPDVTHSASLELNSRFNNSLSNKLLLTGTLVKDDRGPIGSPFPRVTIKDGPASIVFGTEEFSTGNLLDQKNFALFDVVKMVKNNHTFTLGTDNEFSNSKNIFIRQNFGSYVFNSLSTFMNGGTADTYNRTYSLLDPGKSGDESVNAAAKFNSLRLAFFAMDEIKINDNFSITIGLRADYTKFLTTPKTDNFFNDTAVAKLSAYYDLQGARSGQISSPKWSLNPRVGFIYRVPDEGVTIRGGTGFFTGRVPLVWPGGVYNNNGISLAGISKSNVAFRQDPFGQYNADDFGINVPIPSGQVDLIAKNFKMNKVWRTSLGFDKRLANNWKLSLEAIITRNINEINYQRVDILPPTLKTVGPDVRHIYDLSGSFSKQIPLRANGTNPYTGIYLLSNNNEHHGYSSNFTFTIDKAWQKNWAFNVNYSYGFSQVINEGTSSQNNSQWRYMETVNGRNFTGLSRSDFDPGHRISAYLAKKFTYLNGILGTTVSLVYNGQSGSPYSYVLNRGLIRDLDNFETNDLMFVPTTAQLQQMVFLTNTVTSGSTSITYTPDQQRQMLDEFINGDKYLSKRRGQYAERNGARLPFSNVVDLKLQQDFNVKVRGKTYQLQLTYDVFNFTNLLNKNWGRQYFQSNDQFILLDFTGYVSASNLTPQYKFTPVKNNKPYTISDGIVNLNGSSRWVSQLGLRINF